MKKIVILMLALMLALTSVSAMADEKQVTVKYSMPESFEWSAPSEVTLNDDIWTHDGMKDVILVTLTKAKLKTNSYVDFEMNSLFEMTGPQKMAINVEESSFTMTSAGNSAYFSGFSVANGSIDDFGVGDYTACVTITATIVE